WRSMTPTEGMTARSPGLGSRTPSPHRQTLPRAQARRWRRDRGQVGGSRAGATPTVKKCTTRRGRVSKSGRNGTWALTLRGCRESAEGARWSACAWQRRNREVGSERLSSLALSTSGRHARSGSETARVRRSGSWCAREDGRVSQAYPTDTGGRKRGARRGPVHQGGMASGKGNAAGRRGRQAHQSSGRGGWAADSARRTLGSSRAEKAAGTGARLRAVGIRGGKKHGHRRLKGRDKEWRGPRERRGESSWSQQESRTGRGSLAYGA
ncbi:unnamed protein product, partial [Closterium sp. Naga37s-1]